MLRIGNGGGPASSAGAYLLDVIDQFDNSQVGTGQMMHVRRGGMLGAAANIGPVWSLVNGFATEVGRTQGYMWANAISAAATLKRREDTRWPVPIGADQSSLVGTDGYYPLRYRVGVITYRLTNPLIALAPLYFGMAWSGGPLSRLSTNAFSGYELLSSSDVNGGNWTVNVRLANAGALVPLVNTGITPQGAGQQHLEIRYDDTAAPRLSCFINGLEFGVITGLANMPGQAVGNATQIWGVGQGLAVGGGAGQVDKMRRTRFRIQELAGFPD